eukprot:m.124676 g.124676  ORF g.124676 m.124676 type:complete len:171 (+) comp52186_c0_seq6:484-996(+)
MHLAAQAGSLEVLERLLRHGARRDAQDLRGRTPIDWARAKDLEAVVAFLRDFELSSVMVKPAISVARRTELAVLETERLQACFEPLPNCEPVSFVDPALSPNCEPSEVPSAMQPLEPSAMHLLASVQTLHQTHSTNAPPLMTLDWDDLDFGSDPVETGVAPPSDDIPASQ